MAKIGRFAQTPSENKSYVIDYSPWLATDETISDVTFTVTQTTDPAFEITGNAVSTDQKSVSFFASGGTSGTTYKVEVLMTSSTGQIKNDIVEYAVRSI